MRRPQCHRRRKGNAGDLRAALQACLVPRFQQSGLRGMLVRLERQKRRTLPALGKMWAYPSRVGTLTGANTPTEPYETPYNEVRQGTPRTALVFSAALGVFVAIFSTLAPHQDRDHFSGQPRAETAGAAPDGGGQQLAALKASESEIKAALRPPPKPPRKKGWKRFLQVPKNPLAAVAAVHDLRGQALKRHYANSVKAFVQAECLLRPVRAASWWWNKDTSAPAPARSCAGPYLCGNHDLRHRRDGKWRGGVGEHPTHWLLATQVHPRLADGVNNHNVMLFDLNSCALENFEFHYNKYCSQQDLKPFLKEELQAELASRFDCKFQAQHQCMNQIVATRLPSTRRRLDGVAVWVLHDSRNDFVKMSGCTRRTG